MMSRQAGAFGVSAHILDGRKDYGDEETGNAMIEMIVRVYQDAGG